MKRLARAAALLALLELAPIHPAAVHSPQNRLASDSDFELRGEDALVRVYDFILEARFDQVEAELRRACPPAPVEACDVLSATALWWRILLDPESRLLDDEFSALIERAIRRSEAWSERAPDDPEAWFYLGGAYGARVQWRVLRGAKVAAARDGKRIKERATDLAPGLHDAYFGIGLYRYYADVAPAAAKLLRFLLLLPGGDREGGLEQMLRARNKGRLLKGEADYQLHLIYLWYEEEPDRAIDLLTALQKQYPGNPLFLMKVAEIQDTYLHDITRSLDTWRRLLAMAREQRVNASSIAEVRARLGVARLLEELHLTDHAIEQLEPIVGADHAERAGRGNAANSNKRTRVAPVAPYSALPLTYLRLGEAYDRLGLRAQALAAYRNATATVSDDDPYEIRDQAARHLRERPDPKKAEGYRLSLEGFRKLEQNDLPGAAGALERSILLDPENPVTRYRYGRLLQARRMDARALEEFAHVLLDETSCPAPVRAAASLESGRLHERAGHRDEAIESYRMASTLFGGADETRAAARRALDRLARE